jgi:hypothetical protein
MTHRLQFLLSASVVLVVVVVRIDLLDADEKRECSRQNLGFLKL